MTTLRLNGTSHTKAAAKYACLPHMGEGEPERYGGAGYGPYGGRAGTGEERLDTGVGADAVEIATAQKDKEERRREGHERGQEPSAEVGGGVTPRRPPSGPQGRA